MKRQLRTIILLACAAISAIVCYQSYWMMDIYHTLQHTLKRDIQEAIRASDFEEISHRVAQMKEENFGGQMDVHLGSDAQYDKAVVNNEYNETTSQDDSSSDALASSVNHDNDIAYEDFANVLRSEKDVMNVGLHMQRGIHNGLDLLKPIDPNYYDLVLTRRLDSLGVRGRHVSLLLRHDSDSLTEVVDTLYCSNYMDMNRCDTYRFPINVENEQEYVLLINRSIFTLPRQMYSPILVSAFTLLILIAAFWYSISMLRRMWALDEMKSDFTNNITHELKTPIAVAYAANDALLNFDAKSNPEKLKKYLTICQDQLKTLSQLVEQILSLSMERRKSMQLVMEDIFVTPVVEQIISNHRLKTKKEFVAEVLIPQEMTVRADQMHFRNIINNLIDNAIKYSGESIHLVVEGRVCDNGHKTITVKDNGIGIDKDKQRYVFDRFYRVPHGNLHNVKGYGLGLYYVRCMMQRFKGSISLSSELGKGSAFKLIFNG